MTAMLNQIVKGFADELKAVFSLPGTSSPEDQLKPPVSGLFKSLGKEFGVTVASKTEAHLSEEKVRPDIAVYVGGLVCGHVELKKPGLGADPAKLKGEHNKEQWSRLKNLPNLIYTDGREWALYRGGERIGGAVRFDDDPTERGKKAVTADDAEKLSALIRDFLHWKPQVPTKPREFAAFIAPLARFLRSEVEHALKTPDSNVGLLAAEWRQVLFPDADDAQFADAYAQTVTYAMLLARLQGASKLSPVEAAKTLDKNNGLLAKALELLGQDGAREELQVGFELLRRVLEALDPAEFLKTKPDLWLYFYEDFLAAYDPKLRKDYGVYYTPREVVELQVRLASELLEKRFGKKLGFADDGVVFLDPAAGTGTYLVATIKQALEKVRSRSGEGAVAERAVQMAENMYSFEILVGPYAVSHLRLTQALEGAGAKLKKRLNVFLADTLESPDAKPPVFDLSHKAFTEERKAARKVKRDGDILVCLGNPPYDRQQIEETEKDAVHRKGGWVRYGDRIEGGAKHEKQQRPIFADFTEPASKAGAGLHLKNLYNDYVYFWRWALWRLFEQQKCGGIVTFITAASYLAGPGFVGMREVMRRTFDELWVLDLGGDNLGTRKTPNVFAIQNPVAIAIGVRGEKPSPDTPAKVHYAKITSETREGKLTAIDAITALKDFTWQDCPDTWQAPFLPAGKGAYFEWPRIVDLFPWQHSGCEVKRSWPIGETTEVLTARWQQLTASPQNTRNVLLKVTRDRNVNSVLYALGDGRALTKLSAIRAADKYEQIVKYGYRSFDRQFVVLDNRIGDYFRPQLVGVASDKQVFFVTLQSHPLGGGQGITCSAFIPDRHAFRGSYSGKDVIPLYRDAEGTQANVTGGLIERLAKTYRSAVDAEDLAAYVYALLAGQWSCPEEWCRSCG